MRSHNIRNSLEYTESKSETILEKPHTTSRIHSRNRDYFHNIINGDKENINANYDSSVVTKSANNSEIKPPCPSCVEQVSCAFLESFSTSIQKFCKPNSFECKSTIREIQKNIDQIRTSFSRKTQRKRKKKSVASSEPLEDYSRPQSQYKECSNGYLSKDCTENNNLNHIETFGFHGNIDSDYRSYLQSRQEHPKYSSAAYLTPNIENKI
ncbi:unnamed protein product [Moneuplotes crassus]|uniref:Uncharacterized protein n=1 Tax=Euplotes crassus TaxID=5936 RepID=A0AAD1TZM0_EUPCR|nr:unnamed protein product [Moneuplotes crassus]